MKLDLHQDLSEYKQTPNYEYIYSLNDPRTKESKYVGKCKNPRKRLISHIYGCKTKLFRNGKLIKKTEKDKWIKSLLKIGLFPVFDVIKKIPTIEGEYWEEFYVKKYKYELNQPLLNWDDKGKGSAGYALGFIKASKEKRKKVIQYTLMGEKLNTFISLQEAEKATGIAHGDISRVCNKKYNHIKGFIFKYADDKTKITPIINPNAAKKKVIYINANGEIKEFESISQASRETGVNHGNISRICNGIRKPSKTKNTNFKFKTNE